MLFGKKSFKFWADVFIPHLSKSGFKNKMLWKNLMKKRMLFLFLSVATIVFNLSCEKNPVEPIENAQPGRRDYVWTVDTLNYPYNQITRIWGSSPTDVWAVSGGGDLDKTIFHFDGNHWTTDGILRLISSQSIWGFSDNDVWIGGMNGMIWHYNGNNWSEVIRLKKDGNDQVIFDNMWGQSSKDIYATGAYPDSIGCYNNSVIAHFVNNKWEIINTDGLMGIVTRFYINNSDKKIYIGTYRIGAGNYADSSIIFEFRNGKYNRIYSSIWDQPYQADISLINNEVYFVWGNKISKRYNNEFQTVLEVNNPNFYQRIWGRSSKDIFLLMTDGLAHYNGSDMGYLFYFNKVPRTQIFGASLFEKEVFFLTYEAQSNLNLIYHGKLKEDEK